MSFFKLKEFSNSPLFSKIKNILRTYALGYVAFVPVIILLRLFEAFLINSTSSNPAGFIKLEFVGLLIDADYWFRIFIYLLPLFLILSYWLPRTARVVHVSILSLLIILQVSLVQFYSIMSVPLDHAIFKFSLDDILFIISSYGGVSVIKILLLLVFPSVYVVSFYFATAKAKLFSPLCVSLFIFGALLAGSGSKFVRLHTYKQKDESLYNLIVNKEDFFINAAIDYYKELKLQKEVLGNINKSIEKYHQINPGFHYINNDYPFLRQKDTADVLGPFLKKCNGKPNIVVIIVESLSSSYSGPDAQLGSFTPYLDSLSQHSLYWHNCLSTTERSFGVLSAVFGSLPYGEHGFASMFEGMPEHNTLISILNDNGYNTGFAYGQNMKYDGIGSFMKRQNTKLILTEYSPKESAIDGIYPDGIMFQNFYNKISGSQADVPRLDMYYTFSMHSPFIVPNSNFYTQKAKERIDKLNIPDDDKTGMHKYNNTFGCYLYTDECIRTLINSYKQRKDFENTIFIITGDHRIETHKWYGIDRYRVPLIIYSPLIKKPVVFKSVVNHWQITPTLLAFLDKNYKIKTPDKVHWLGGMLDTCKSFRNKTDFVLMRYNCVINNYLHDNYYLSDTTLYTIDSNLNLTVTKNEPIKKLMAERLMAFKTLNFYVCREGRVVPPKSFATPKQQVLAAIIPDKEFNKNIEYGNLCSDVHVPIKTRSLAINIKFEIYANKTTVNTNPLIAVSLNSDKDSLNYWEGDKFTTPNLDTIPTHRWTAISISKIVNYDLRNIKPGGKLNMTIWNYKGLEEFKVRNIRLSVEAFF